MKGFLYDDTDIQRWRDTIAEGNVPPLGSNDWNKMKSAVNWVESNGPMAAVTDGGAPRDCLTVADLRGENSQIKSWSEQGSQKGVKNLQYAAVYALMHNNTRLAQEIATVCATQASKPGVDLGVSPPWCWEKLITGPAGGGSPGFMVGNWFVTWLWTWDYVRPYATDQQHAIVNRFVERALLFFKPLVKAKITQHFANAPDNYKPTNSNSSNSKSPNEDVYLGGPKAGRYGVTFNNRIGMQCVGVLLGGLLVDDEEAIQIATDFWRCWVIGTVGDGFNTESHRGNGSLAKGMSYVVKTTSQACTAAAALANNGRRDALLDWTTTEGIGATANAGRRGIITAAHNVAKQGWHETVLHCAGMPKSDETILDLELGGHYLWNELAFAVAQLDPYVDEPWVQRVLSSGYKGETYGPWNAGPAMALQFAGSQKQLILTPELPPVSDPPVDEGIGLPELQRGARGEDAKTLQGLLIARGFAPANTIRDDQVDGIFGPGTEGALKQFQTHVGIEATGVVDDVTWQRLLQL